MSADEQACWAQLENEERRQREELEALYDEFWNVSEDDDGNE